MPPAAVRTINDLMYWQYAKIIAGSGGMGKREWLLNTNYFKTRQSGKIAWGSTHEYVMKREEHMHCIYCGREQ